MTLTLLLPTCALEHKYFAGAFANARPAAQLWVAPYQYSFPLDLPLVAQGFPPQRSEASATLSYPTWGSHMPRDILSKSRFWLPRGLHIHFWYPPEAILVPKRLSEVILERFRNDLGTPEQ